MKKRIITLFLILSIFSFSENVIRKVSVTGNSEKEVMPDVATVTFQIKTKNSNLIKTKNVSGFYIILILKKQINSKFL